MGFKILNKEGKAVTIAQLDQEACILWGKELDPKHYANPSPKDTSVFLERGNWYDIIGYMIHSPHDNWTSGWDNVKNSLYLLQISGELYNKTIEQQIESLKNANRFLEPYINLINYWESKGYVPEQVKE